MAFHVEYRLAVGGPWTRDSSAFKDPPTAMVHGEAMTRNGEAHGYVQSFRVVNVDGEDDGTQPGKQVGRAVQVAATAEEEPEEQAPAAAPEALQPWGTATPVTSWDTPVAMGDGAPLTGDTMQAPAVEVAADEDEEVT